MTDRIIADIWGEAPQTGLRVVALEQGQVRLEITEGVSRKATQAVTLADFRVGLLRAALTPMESAQEVLPATREEGT